MMSPQNRFALFGIMLWHGHHIRLFLPAMLKDGAAPFDVAASGV